MNIRLGGENKKKIKNSFVTYRLVDKVFHRSVDLYSGRQRRGRPTCPHDQHHHDDDELPGPQLGGLSELLHRDLIWRGDTEQTRLRMETAPPVRGAGGDVLRPRGETCCCELLRRKIRGFFFSRVVVVVGWRGQQSVNSALCSV